MSRGRYSDKSILIVDDNESVLRQLKRILRAIGIKKDLVRTATNGVDALNECKSNPPDLMLLDIIMPVVSGWEVLQELKKLGIKTKVIIFSVRNDAESGLEAARLGATDYLPKSDLIEYGELKIKRALDHGAPITENTTATLIRNFVDELAREIHADKKMDEQVVKHADELVLETNSSKIDKKKALGLLRFIEDSLSHSTGNLMGHGAIRGIEKLLDFLS